MTSFRQIEVNRAISSTSPKTEDGKRRSRHNALRHGSTAETVVVALEHIQDYRAFEASVIAGYDAQTAVERELVLRLSSLLWRIRRATVIETDLLQIQAEILHERRRTIETTNQAEQKLHSISLRALQPAHHSKIFTFMTRPSVRLYEQTTSITERSQFIVVKQTTINQRSLGGIEIMR